MNGSEFAKILVAGNLSGIERELAVLRARPSVSGVGGGGIWAQVVSTATIAGKARRLVMQCSPLPFAIGTNVDPFLCPAWPWTYQALANELGAVIPTRKMCLLANRAAEIRIEPQPFPLTGPDGKGDGGKYNESSARYAQSNEAIFAALKTAGYSPGQLVAGAKKDVVVGPGLDGSKVAIWGWPHKGPIGSGADTSADRWQPYSTIHESTYSDYSHGWRVFRRKAKLDGAEIDLDDVATDKLLHVLVSDQGPFLLRFPNTSPEVAPPPGYPPGSFAKGGTGTGSGGTKSKKAAIVGGAVLGGTVGFVVGGPVGAAVGAVLGGALGRT